MLRLLYLWVLLCPLTWCQDSKIDAPLGKKLDAGELVNVVVTFRPELIQGALDKAKAARSSGNRLTNAQTLYSTLNEAGASSQAGVLQMLGTRSAGQQFRSFRRVWTSNRLFVREANAATVKAIAGDGNVAKIEVEPVLRLPTKENQERLELRQMPSMANGWNLNNTRVREAWEALGGNRGDGVIVGVIDSGAHINHKALQGKWREELGWFDPANGTTAPFDDHGHGTSSTGLIVGQHESDDFNWYGMAPGAKFIVCRACYPSGDCPLEFCAACLAWMACPSLPDGSGQDCSKAPRVINVSIGDVHGSLVNKEDIERVREAGVIPVYGIGNEGPHCRSVTSPGELSIVIGVGVHDSLNQVWQRSAVGPAYDGTMKPDLIAPGFNVLKPMHIGDYYDHALGSSIASPHVAGAVVLLLVRNPELTFDQAHELLTKSAISEGVTMRPHPNACNESTIEPVPNIFFGHGRLDIFGAVELQTKMLAAVSP